MSKKVRGVRGLFFKSQDQKKSRECYSKHLGFKTDDYGSLFEFRLKDNPDIIGHLQCSPFENDTKYFEPSKKEFIINFRVDNLVRSKGELETEGVTICDEIQEFEYGKFLHIMEPEGNKIELW